MEKLTPKQQKAFESIIKTIKEKGYPPTITELRDALGAASRNTAVKYFHILARKGYIHWENNKARGVQILHRKDMLDGADEQSLPLVGAVTAGLPMLAEENIERYISVPRFLIRSASKHFLLRVKGSSMRNAGIYDKDLVIVRSQKSADIGDIVVALINNEATVKRLAMDKNRRYLKAENPEYKDIYPQEEWEIQGKVVSLLRESVE
jgi:repressor LexA